MAEKALDRCTYEEYLAIEAASDQRYEYYNGYLVAMPGGSPDHGRIASNIATELNLACKQHRPTCGALSSDVKVHVRMANQGYYPDVSVVCGPVEKSPQDPKAITNPVLVVEVLSQSTVNRDYGDKFINYRLLPTLQHYVLVSQSEPKVEVFTRQPYGWELRTYQELEVVIDLPYLACQISLADIYRLGRCFCMNGKSPT